MPIDAIYTESEMNCKRIRCCRAFKSFEAASLLSVLLLAIGILSSPHGLTGQNEAHGADPAGSDYWAAIRDDARASLKRGQLRSNTVKIRPLGVYGDRKQLILTLLLRGKDRKTIDRLADILQRDAELLASIDQRGICVLVGKDQCATLGSCQVARRCLGDGTDFDCVVHPLPDGDVGVLFDLVFDTGEFPPESEGLVVLQESLFPGTIDGISVSIDPRSFVCRAKKLQ